MLIIKFHLNHYSPDTSKLSPIYYWKPFSGFLTTIFSFYIVFDTPKIGSKLREKEDGQLQVYPESCTNEEIKQYVLSLNWTSKMWAKRLRKTTQVTYLIPIRLEKVLKVNALKMNNIKVILQPVPTEKLSSHVGQLTKFMKNLLKNEVFQSIEKAFCFFMITQDHMSD